MTLPGGGLQWAVTHRPGRAEPLCSPSAAFMEESRMSLAELTGMEKEGTVFARVFVFNLLDHLSDGLDHPELWPALIGLARGRPDVEEALDAASHEVGPALAPRVLAALCRAEVSALSALRDFLQTMMTEHGSSPLLQGAIFYLDGRLNPGDTRYDLVGKICPEPFTRLDVSESTTHLCCQSWLPTSLGDPREPGVELWNAPLAREIRASVHDGSYRHCNKLSCPSIQKGILLSAEELRRSSPKWEDVVSESVTALGHGPELVNLAYDRTCNLSCPSCRSEAFAADSDLRRQFARMQTQTILPLLATADTVVVTGSGDPFASKNFRQLMRALTAEDYPGLRFWIMTNGMLLTPEQWALFPALHGRVEVLKISIDAARGETHERLRRGSRWATMRTNLAYAGALAKEGQVSRFELTFVVQSDNFREMGEAVDLARAVGASCLYFSRIVNWNTFTETEYAEKAIFLPTHPDYAAFMEAMGDPRLSDPIVWLGNLQSFVPLAMASPGEQGAADRA